MGRAATARGTTGRGARVVDQSAGRVLSPDQGPGGAPPRGSPRTRPVLPTPATAAQPTHPGQEPLAGEVMLQQVWFQLPGPDRQRFGHCFSSMVLKALGLRPCPIQEVQP